MKTTTRRRVANGVLGAAGGLLSGLGLAVEVTQSGVGRGGMQSAGMIAVAVVGGASIGASEPRRWARRGLVVATLLYPLLVTVLVHGAVPAYAQESCADVASTVLTLDGSDGARELPLPATSPSDPLILDLTRTDRVTWRTEAAAAATGTLTLEVGAVRPFGFLGGTGVVYHGPVDNGVGEGAVEVAGTWPIRVEPGAGRTVLTETPLGRIRLDATLRDGDGQAICEQQLWVRFVSSPLAHPLGWAAIAAQWLGAVAVAGALWRRGPLPPPDTAPPPPPPPPPGEYTVCMPDGGPAPGTLAPGMPYELRVGIGLSISEQEAEPAVAPVTGVGADPPHQLVVELSVSQGVFSFPIPFRTLRSARAQLIADVLVRGGLVRSVRYDLAVASGGGTAAAPHEAVTLIDDPPPPPGAADRAAAVLLHPEASGLAVRMIGAEGQNLLPHKQVAATAVTQPAAAAHEALAAGRAGRAGALATLARAGAALHASLAGDAAPLANVAGPGSIVQVRFGPGTVGAGVPWTALYGLPPPEGDGRLCTSFEQHLLDECPERAADPGTVCPNGFWGLRYGLELSGADAPGSAGDLELLRHDGEASSLRRLGGTASDGDAARLAALVDGHLGAGLSAGEAWRRGSRELLAVGGSLIGLAYRLRSRPDVVAADVVAAR